MSEIPSNIQKGLLYAIVDGVRLLGVPRYFDCSSANDKWAIEVEVNLIFCAAKQELQFPQSSRWFVVVDHDYPYGNIDIYPSKEGGIATTYYHQSYNCGNNGELPWRTGKICVDKPIQKLGLLAGHYDPIGDFEERIRWHLLAALAWIKAAATDTLVRVGDPFETPFYPCHPGKKYVYDESGDSYSTWMSVKPGEWGFAIWDCLEGIKNTEFAVAYFNRNSELIRSTSKYDEAKHVLNTPEAKQGFWWLWKSPVILYPWQVPMTWGELRIIGSAQHIKVDQFLRAITKIWQGRDETPLMIGYPIPNRFGDTPSEIYWHVIMLPKIISAGNDRRKQPSGYRSIGNYLWWRERRGSFSDNENLVYKKSQNWHSDRLQARGRLSQSLRESKIILIGCGALGSFIAEQLVRGGVSELVFIDPDSIEMGNLVRHTLSGQDIDENKATALVQRLRSVAPFAKINTETKRFPTGPTDVTTLIEDYDIVIDCTAEEEVLSALSTGWWSMGKLFLSASVGYKAMRTFLFAHRGQKFPFSLFQSMLEPFLEKERHDWEADGETTEGAGCWSPLFPARMDDLLLAASSSIKLLEELVENHSTFSKLVLFEQVIENGFQGVHRLEISGKDS